MKLRPKTYFYNHFKLLLSLFLAFIISGTAKAQVAKSVYKTSILYDTLVASSNRDYLYNNITITNLTTDKISLLINITAPQGWQLIGQNILTVSLGANENTVINLRMVASTSKTANWQKVKIDYKLNSGIETTTDTFRVRVKEFLKFKANLPNPSLVLGAYQRNIGFPVFIKNSGNTPTNYTVRFSNELLNLNYMMVLNLQPGQDTTYQLPLRLSENQWANMKKEEVKVQVSGPDGETANLLQTISKVGFMLKEHASAYLDMPLQLETGATYQGKNTLQYYGAVHGNLDITNDDKVAFDLRTNTYSEGQVAKNNIVRAEYAGKHLYGRAGNIQEFTDFPMDGYGAKAGYAWKERNRAEVYGMFKSRTGNSQLGGANAEIMAFNNVKLIEALIANFDKINNLNSYEAKQGGEIRFAETGKFTFNAGIGMEQKTGAFTGTGPSSQVGSSLGYTFNWNNKHLSVLSNLLYNSNAFPGIFKGQRQQMHDVRAMFKNVFIGGYYEYNFRKQNIFSDTALFSDVFNLKTDNYGARVGGSFTGTNFTLSAGQQTQVQTKDTAYQFEHYVFTYANLNMSLLFFKKLMFSTNSYFGQGRITENPLSPHKFITSNQGTLQYKFASVSVRYDNGPYYYHDYTSYVKKPERYERLIISPSADVNLFKHSLNLRGQFNYAKSLPGGTETSNILTNVAYMNIAHGFDFTMSAIVPIKQLSSQPYVSATLRVRLHTPFVAVRKYYQVKVIMFKDANSNGYFDQGEQAVNGQMVSMNGNLFVSDDRGWIIYKNVAKGTIKADYGLSSKMKGWIPVGGTIQSYDVSGNKTVYVPYKMSKVLQGKLNLILDSNSNLSFSVANIKVIAKGTDDTTGNVVFSTLTDVNGEFYFNVPSGNYIVTLSELAFDDNFKPTQYAQPADMVNNNIKNIYFDIKQKKRQINIKRK